MKRVLIRITTAFLAGVLVTITLAWLASALISPKPVGRGSGADSGWDLRLPEEWRGAQAIRKSARTIGVESRSDSLILMGMPGSPSLMSRDYIKELRNPDNRPAESRIVIVLVEGAASGWPLRAMEWQIGTDPQNSTAYPGLSVGAAGGRGQASSIPISRVSVDAVPLRLNMSAFGGPATAKLPLRPIWPGFLIDSALFAAMFFTLTTGARWWRVRRRSRRGQCIRCGYPIGAAQVCTECGAAVNPIAASTAPPTDGAAA